MKTSITYCAIILAFSVDIFGFDLSSCSRKEYDDVMLFQNLHCHLELDINSNLSKAETPSKVSHESEIKKLRNEKTKLKSNVNNQLLTWLKEMKNIWKDFPVDGSEQNRLRLPIKYFDVCKNDKNFKDENDLKLNSKGTLNGSSGVLIFNENNSICHSKLGVAKINGTFIGGLLNGAATIFFRNGSFIRTTFQNGSISGLLRRFSCQYGSCDFDYQPWNVPNRLEEVRII